MAWSVGWWKEAEMYRGCSIVAFLSLLLGLSTQVLGAQYVAGDAIVYGLTGTFLRVSPQGAVASASPPLCCQVSPFMVAPDNRSIWYMAQQVQPSNRRSLCRLAYDGSTTSILQNPPFNGGGGTDLTGNGYLIDVGGSVILKGTVSTGFTTLYAGQPFSYLTGGCIDLATGDLIALDFSTIYRVSLLGKPTVTSIARWSGPVPLPLKLHFDPESGDIVGVWFWAIHRITLGTPASVSTLFDQKSWLRPEGLDRDPRDGRFGVLAWQWSNSQSGVFRFDARSKAITTLAMLPPSPVPLPPGGSVGPVFAGSRHLWPGSEARPGRPYRLMVSSPNEPGADYVIALSLGYRPGIPVAGGRKIYLNPDPLLSYSLTNSGIFSGFQGRLDPQGEAPASVAIPGHPGLSGLRFFASAVTIVNHRISVISEPLGVTIQ